MSIGIVAESVRTSVPVIACTTPWTIATAISTRWRGSRSAQTPAASTIAASAICRAASTSPSAIAESDTCNTAKTSAMMEMPSPSPEIVELANRRRKLRSASAPTARPSRIACFYRICRITEQRRY